jgi:hypothetical protein
MPYRSIKTKYKDIILNEHNDESKQASQACETERLDAPTIERDGIPKRKYSIVHDNGIYRLTAMNVRIREEKGYSMETTLVYNCKYNAAKIAEGRYSQSKANQYASNIDQLIITLLMENPS